VFSIEIKKKGQRKDKRNKSMFGLSFNIKCDEKIVATESTI